MKLPRLLTPDLQESRRLHPIALQISESLIPLSTATMTVKKGDEVEGRSLVRLFTPNGRSEVYRTRVPEVTHGGNTSTIQLEHAICEVGDFVIQDAIKEELTVREAFVRAWNHYRGNLWQLGNFSSNTAVILDCDYDNLLETLLSILDQAHDSIMTFDFTTSPWTVSVAEKSLHVTAEGRMSRNIAAAAVKRDDKELCTRVYVRGLPKPSGRESDENAVGYMDADTISEYGVVEKETGGSNLTQAQATRIATAYLEAHKHPKLSVELDAADLSEITGEERDSFVPGKLFRLVVPEEHLVIEDYITKVSWSDVIGSPFTASVVIGDEQDATINFLQAQASASKGSAKRAKEQAKTDEAFVKAFEKTDEYGAILEQAGMQLDSHGMIIYARDNINNIGMIIDMTASALRSEYSDGISGLQSTIEQTASSIRLEVASTKSDVHSLIVQTPELIHTEVGSAVSGFAQSVIDQTATYIRTEVHGAASQIAQSVIEQTAEYIQTTVEATASEVAWSVITQTMTNIEQKIGSKSRIFVGMNPPSGTIYEGDIWIKSTAVTTWGGLALGKWQDRSTFRWKDYAGCEQYVYQDGAWVLVVDSSIITDQETKIDQDKTQISLLARKVDNLGTDYQSRLSVTAERIRGDVSTAKSQIYSVVEQTATNVFSGVYDRVSDNFSTIEQTAQSISMSVGAAKSALYTQIMVTATGIETSVQNYLSGNYSTIRQTSTDIAIAVASSKTDWMSAINIQKGRIDLVVSGSGSGASINMTNFEEAINGSSITINADRINLNGYVKATDFTGDQIATKLASVSSLTVNTVLAGAVSIVSGQTTSPVATQTYVSGCPYDMRITSDNNTYTLQWKRLGYTASWADIGSFSRAISSFSGAWNGSAYTITANPQSQTYTVGFGGQYSAHDLELSVEGNGLPSRSSSTAISVPVQVKSLTSSGSTQRYTKDLTVSMSGILQTKTATSNGTVTPDSSYIGLSRVYVNVSTSLAGSWSGGTVTVSASQGDSWYSSIFAERDGNATKDTVWENRVNVPYKISAYNNGSEYPVATGKTGTLNVDISALMQDKDLSGQSSGTYYPDSGYVGFESVTISGSSSPSASNISIDNAQFNTGTPSGIGTFYSLDDVSREVRNNSHGYVYFRARISGGTGEKWFRFTLP